MILLLTGGVMIYVDYGYVPSDPFAIQTPWWSRYSTKAHVLFSPVFVFFFGWIAATHIKPRYASKRPQGRRSGMVNSISWVGAIVTGYALQVITSRSWMDPVAWVHIGIGLMAMVTLALHDRVSMKPSKQNLT